MYSNYLAEVGKLAYIIGQIQTTSAFKKMLESNNDVKSKFYFKCVDELPVTAYKKIKIDCRRKGILRCDWFSKILDRSPMMIFMVFNYCQPLDNNQKWEDRLSITIRKINKVADVLRSSNKQEIILKIIIIISKQAVLQSSQTGNVVEKISSFLKNYEKQLAIYQSDQLMKQVNKNKSYWFSMLEKAYQRKYRAIAKRKEQSLGERKLGCSIKMAIISEIISKKDSYSQYEQAYRSLLFRFGEIMKTRIQLYTFDQIRELRTLADIVLLRKLIVKINISNNYGSVAESISNHLKHFNQSYQNDSFFFAYENTIWRQNFLHNLLQVLHVNDHIEIVPKSYFAQLINTAISFSYKLCRAEKQINPILANLQPKGKLIPIQNQLYIGSHNYSMGLNVTDLDVLWTEMNDLMERKKDYVTRGLQTITRYKSLKVFKKHQINFFNIYLLRFYLADQKFTSIGNMFNQIIRLKMSQYDFYSLNYLIEQLERETQKSQEHKTLIHSLAVLIADYFKNQQQLQKYGSLLIDSLSSKQKAEMDLLSQNLTQASSVKAAQSDPIVLPLPSQSFIFKLQVQFKNQMHMIENPLQIEVIPKFNNQFLSKWKNNAILKLYFNKPQIKHEHILKLSDLSSENKIIISINPLQYFSKDENLQITRAALILQGNTQVHLLAQSITFNKIKSVLMITKLKMPQININMPYQIYYMNETSKFLLNIGSVDKSIKLDISFAVKEQPSCNTQIFMDVNQRLNLVNSDCFTVISANQPNLIFLRCNKLGSRIIKFLFEVTVTQQIGDKQLKDHHIVIKEVGFRVINLFKSLKLLKQTFTGNQIKPHQIPPNKNIIMSYSVRAVQMINIVQFGQHKSPKTCFKTNKDINILNNFIITPEERLKNVYMFEVKQEQLSKQEKKQLFLITFYIKWNRIDMDLKLGLSNSDQIINLYNEDDVRISLKNDKVEVEYEQGKTLRKRQKQTLTIKYRNLTNDPIHVYSMMENSQSILRIGSKGTDLDLGSKEIKTVIFQILPVKSGYYKYPQVRSYFDGIQAKEKTCSSIICVV